MEFQLWGAEWSLPRAESQGFQDKCVVVADPEAVELPHLLTLPTLYPKILLHNLINAPQPIKARVHLEQIV